MERNTRGSLALAAIMLVAVAIGGIYLASDGNLLGAIIGVETISSCDIAVYESIDNIAHDFECYEEDGFVLKRDNVEINCRNHSITCMDCQANATHNFSGFKLSGRDNVTIKNCRIYGFDHGVRMDAGGLENTILSNLMDNNTQSLFIDGTYGHLISLNTFSNGTLLIQNINNTALFTGDDSGEDLNETLVNGSDRTQLTDYNASVIYDNKFLDGQDNAQTDSNSYVYWNVAKSPLYDLDPVQTNIVGGHFLGGNFWGSYHGYDTDGDGLGNTDTPHRTNESIEPILDQGDRYPLIENVCSIPGSICGEVTCPDMDIYADEGGEGLAITCDDTVLTCNGTRFIGQGSNANETHMRAIEVIGYDNVTIQGCEFINFTYGVYLEDTNDLTLYNNSIHNNLENVFLKDRVHDSLIHGNTFIDWNSSETLAENASWTNFTNSTRGIVFNGGPIITSTATAMGGNKVYDNTFGPFYGGWDMIHIELLAGSLKNNISQNSFVNITAPAAVGTAIKLVDVSDDELIIEGNLIQGGYTGIHLENSSMTLSTTELNTFLDYYRYGVLVDNLGGQKPTISGVFNTSSSLGWGVLIEDGEAFIDQVNISGGDSGLCIFNPSNYGMIEIIGDVLIQNTSDSGLYGVNALNCSADEQSYFDLSRAESILLINNSRGIYSNCVGIIPPRYESDPVYGSGIVNITNNTFGLYVGNLNGTEYPTNITDFFIYNNSVGVTLVDSVNITFFNNYFSGNTININDTSGQNHFNITPQIISGRDNNIYYNVSDTASGNVYFGGNFYAELNVTDITGDGIADIYGNGTSILSYPYTQEGNFSPGDYYPLTTPGEPQCDGTYSESFTLMSNLSSNGTCFYFAADGITLDCDGYNVTGNGTGSFINATGYDSLTVVNCNVEHFSNLILANHTATVEDSNVTFINNYTLNLENVTFDNVVLTNVTEMTINGTSTLSSIEYYNNSILHVYGNATIEDSTFENNVCGLYYYNGTNKTISGNIFEDNSFGLVVEFANATNITANKFINSKNLSLNISGINSTIYNNLFRNDSGKPNVVVSGTHFWNVSYHQLSSGTNIVGNSYMGGNYWSGYTGVDNGNATNEHVPNVSGDFIGDTLVPYNDSTTFINDSLPLIGTPDCQEVTSDLSMTADLYVDSLSDGEACYLITGDNLVFDLGGFTIEGDSEGYAIKVQDAENVTIINGIISGFEIGVYIDPSNNITVNNVTINISDYGIRLEDTTDSLIVNNTIYNISYTGLDIINSTDNLVYNNIINVTDCSSSCTEYNVYQDSNSSNSFNVTYQPGTNILGGNMSGGNYYGNYAGIDSGSGFGNYSVQGDMVGDTQVPYQINDNLDYFPLTNDDGEGHSNCISITEDTALNTDIFCDEDEAVYIAADNVLLDCNGHSITGSGSGSGIKSIGYNNITIRECNISNFYYGINIQGGSVINIDKENVITDNSFYGIYMVDVNDTTITNTSLERDNNGIYVVNGSYVNVTDNLIALNKKFYGVFMFDSDNVYVHSNDFSRNYHGSYFVNVDGASVQYNTYDDHDYFASYSATFSDAHTYYKNTFNDARTLLRVYQNVSGITVKNNTFGESSQYALRFHGDIDDVNMSGNTFNGSTSKVSTAHIMLSDIDNLNLTDNNFSSDLSVMQVGSSTNVQSINNTYTSNGSVGFADVALLNIYGDAYSRLLDVDGASDLTVMNITSVNVTMVDIVKSTLAENLFTNNTLEDTIDVDTSSNIQLSYSSADTMVVSNTDYLNARFFDLNTTAVLDSVLGEHFRDIDIQDSNKTAYNFTDVDSMNIVYNVLRRNAGGILLQGDSDGNIIAENWIEDNGYGLNITSSDSNTIKDNYFDNTENVDDTGSNTWYGSYTCSDGPNIVGGPCKGGNFYNDFYGLDNGYSGGVEGDGISDQPTRYNVDSDTYDELPLMLYVSRVYYAPSDSATASLTATASYTGTLEDGEIVPNVWQYITYSSSYPIWRFRSLFNETDFNASTFVLSSNGTNTYFNFSGITDLGNTAERSEVDYATVMLQHQQRLNGGVCIDWNATGLEPDSCDKRIKSMGGAMNASANSSHYLVNFNTAPVVNRSGVAYVDFNMTCGAHIYHDITLTEDVSCNQSAFIVKADNIVIDLNGNELIGNGSGIGVNISDYDNVTLTGGTVSNFTTAVYVDPAVGINISGMTIADSFIGVNFSEINNSYITSNTFLRLNRSVQLVESDHNQIFDNTFVNGTVGVRVLASDNLTLENNVLYNFVTEAMYLNLIDGVNITNVSIYNSTNGITVRNTGSLTVFKLLFNGSDGIPLMMYKVSGSNLLNNTFNHSTTTVTFDAVNSTVMANNKAYNLKNYSVYFQNTTNVTLYNNLFNTTYPAYHDAHSNISWNTTLNCSNINILGGNCTGGNYWGSYDGWDVDLDGVGETLLPFNGSDTGAFGDMLPLTEVGEISCGGTEQNVTMNVTLNQDITVNLTDDETCFNLQTPAITFDCSGYSLIGNGTGMAVNMSAQNTFKNCIVSNFSIGATMVDHGTINRSVIKGSVLGVSQLGDAFILNSTIYDVVTGISRRDNNEGYIRGTYVGANDTCVKIRNISHAHFIQVAGNEFNCPIGVDITNASIRVYDNIFNTSNVSIISHNDTIFNSSYNCSRTNILGNNCTGGNWYSDYQDDGKDDGNGTYSGIPNISSDGIADNPVPYNASGNITLGGDYLPLLGNYTSSLTSRLAALTNDDDSSDDSSSDDDGGDGDSGSSGSGSSGGGGSGSSSSSSSSGGGGGSSYTLTSDDCTQEWECDDWSVCDDNFQVRDCTDANNCFEEYGLGNFVRKEKPEEEQWCPGDFSDTETVPEQIVVTPPQVIVQQEEGPVNMTLLLASGIGGFTFLGGLFIGYDLIAPHRRLRRRLRKIEGSVDVSSVDTLKSHYGSAYELYMRLSESKKQDYYGRVMSLRSQIEGQLLAEKRIENLIDLAKKSDKSTEKRKYYMRVYKMYESLSPVLQSKVYQKIVDLREELEGGKF